MSMTTEGSGEPLSAAERRVSDRRLDPTPSEMGELAYYAVFGHWDRLRNKRVPGLLELRDRDFGLLRWGIAGIGLLVLQALGVPLAKVWPAISAALGVHL